MSRNKCCVPLCHNTISDDGVVLHFFPNPVKDSERFRLWVLKIGGEIVGLDDNTIFKNRRVCHKHFAERFLYLSNRLSKTAVPQFQLPAPHRLQTIINRDDTVRLPVEVPTTPALVAPVPSTSQSTLPQNEHSKAGKQDSKDHSTTQPTNIEVSNDTTRVENIGKQDPKDGCTAEPTFTENSNDSFTGVENDDELPEQAEISDVSMEAAPSAPMQFCICCLRQGVPLVNLLTCSHADFLNILMVPQIQPEDKVVCYTCHQMLKKIRKFKRQVQKSFKLLSENSIVSNENSLKKYSNHKDRLTIHETLNMEIQTPETNEDTTTDNTEKVTPKSSHKDRKMKNIEEALKIINGNQNNEYFDLLSTSLKSLSQSLIGDIYSDSQSSNTTDLTARPNDTAVEDITDKHTDGSEEEYIMLDVRESDTQTGASDAPTSHKRASPNIKQLTLSKRALFRERATLLSSATYARARHRCRSCVVAFTFRDNLQDHVSRKHTAPPDRQSFMKCRVCRQFVRRDAYNIHRSSHYTRYKCLSCGQIFSSYDDAALHDKKQHSSVTELKCTRCSFKTTRKRLLKKHSLVCNTRLSGVR